MLKEPTEVEVNGMYAGGEAGGAYLESIGKTDMAVLTEGEWMTMIERIIQGFQLHCAKLWESEIPY